MAGAGGISASMGRVGCAELLVKFEGSGIFSLSPLGGMGRKMELTPCSAETGTELFPFSKAEFFPLSVFFCAGENMENFSVESPPSGSVGGCLAPSAAAWETFHSL